MAQGGEQNGEPNRGKMAVTEMMEEAAAMRGREEYGRFDWSGFFKNPYVLPQILLYICVLYTVLPGHHDLGALLVWLLVLLPMCMLNLVGTHKLKEFADKHKRQKND